jgi:hypothetical protein
MHGNGPVSGLACEDLKDLERLRGSDQDLHELEAVHDRSNTPINDGREQAWGSGAPPAFEVLMG